MVPASDGVATGLTLDLVFLDACKAAVGGSDRCWPTVQSWRNACCGACCSVIRAWCCWMGPVPTPLPDPCCSAWVWRRFPRPCACTGGPSPRSAWRMFMGWLVLNWGDRWGASGVGRADRCAALRNPNGVVSSDLLEGLAVVDGPKGDEFGTVGSALGQGLRRRLRQRWVPRFGAVPWLRG